MVNTTNGSDASPPFGQTLENPVLVPFCLESALSGVTGKGRMWSWYQTSFVVPSSWPSDSNVILNFGAVDYEATIFVNGKNAGFHRGGYFEFSVDVTQYLSANGTNELLVYTFDPTDVDMVQIPIGKQTLNREGMIWYTPCSGIWQTVWLESTPKEHISKLDLTADMDGTVTVTVHSSTNLTNIPYEITVHELGSTDAKATAKGTSGSAFTFNVPSPELWTPDSPTLYNITIKMASDTIQSYTGFRTVSRGTINGIQRPLLNGKFVFPFGTLDQGYWPDGIYTPPSVEAMVYDLKVLKNVGYNMVRKHIKVEPALFYRACDEMGMLVIQDMPSLRPDLPDGCGSKRLAGQDAQDEFDRQLALMVEQLKSYPSIFAWTIYNEEWGQDTSPPWPEFPLTEMVRKIDPTRLVNSVSGWTDHTAGDFDDNHHYSTPQCGTPFWSRQGNNYDSAYDSSRIGLQGEFGGIGTQLPEDDFAHAWFKDLEKQTAYELTNGTNWWNYRCHDLLNQLREQIDLFACSGGVWTQTTDVEGEVNGMMTYDRKVVRMNETMWKQDIQALYDAAEKRANNATMVIRDVSSGGLQYGMP
ncbi:uncharacterized protein J4E87_009834 [Alternaria ethzedia]|uniref:uncharacterized protein n=1 Tax=Alternaria ethzedia TaxID=181014 RepID=UPI0020C26291|nr:uncharacterized protein J4E87_009834 [Alternaria ethzedia]KAI4613533.1 hypothetical protein J4E87_009834 [Alternaria ethzedia]